VVRVEKLEGSENEDGVGLCGEDYKSLVIRLGVEE
jgi:hypothetical protein